MDVTRTVVQLLRVLSAQRPVMWRLDRLRRTQHAVLHGKFKLPAIRTRFTCGRRYTCRYTARVCVCTGLYYCARNGRIDPEVLRVSYWSAGEERTRARARAMKKKPEARCCGQHRYIHRVTHLARRFVVSVLYVYHVIRIITIYACSTERYVYIQLIYILLQNGEITRFLPRPVLSGIGSVALLQGPWYLLPGSNGFGHFTHY